MASSAAGRGQRACPAQLGEESAGAMPTWGAGNPGCAPPWSTSTCSRGCTSLSRLLAYTLWDIDVTVANIATPPTATAAPRRIVRLSRPSQPCGPAASGRRSSTSSPAGPSCAPSAAAEIVAQLTPPVVFWSSVVNLQPERQQVDARTAVGGVAPGQPCRDALQACAGLPAPGGDVAQLQPMIADAGARQPAQRACDRGASSLRTSWPRWSMLRQAAHTEFRGFDQLMRQAARVAINRTVAGCTFRWTARPGRCWA